jgi:hypothetical protein
MAKGSKREDAKIRRLAKAMIELADVNFHPERGAMAALVACIGMAYAAGIPRDVFMNTVKEMFDQAEGN